MRSRNIKPGFFKNDSLAECSFEARLLYIGLWCLADRDGYIEYRPKRIKAEIFPYDSVIIEKLLDELRHFISFLGDAKKQFLRIENFSKHQSPHKNEKGSDFEHLSTYREITRNFKEFLPDSLIEDIRKEDIRKEEGSEDPATTIEDIKSRSPEIKKAINLTKKSLKNLSDQMIVIEFTKWELSRSGKPPKTDVTLDIYKWLERANNGGPNGQGNSSNFGSNQKKGKVVASGEIGDTRVDL